MDFDKHWTRSRRDGDDEESFAFSEIHGLRNIKNPSHSRLGQALRAARRTLGLTQWDVASVASCSLPSVTQAELGLGGSKLFERLALAAGHELSGSSLASGELGAGLAALRRRRGLSRAAVAEMAGVSIPSVAAVEAGSNVRVPGLAAIATVLAAGLRLSAIGAARAYWTDTAASSAFGGWTTPSEILERLYRVVGGQFTLDPCSQSSDRRCAIVRARVHLSVRENGLAHDWHGNVYVNSPYGRGLGTWTSKCRSSVESGSAELVIALLPARSDTSWWHRDVAGHADVVMLKGRLAFGDGTQAAPFASALACWGADTETRMALKAEFPDAWHVGRASVLDAIF